MCTTRRKVITTRCVFTIRVDVCMIRPQRPSIAACVQGSSLVLGEFPQLFDRVAGVRRGGGPNPSNVLGRGPTSACTRPRPPRSGGHLPRRSAHPRHGDVSRKSAGNLLDGVGAELPVPSPCSTTTACRTYKRRLGVVAPRRDFTTRYAVVSTESTHPILSTWSGWAASLLM